MNQNDRPDFQSPHYAAMLPVWQKAVDLMTGVDALRNETYLPKHPLEHDRAHELRMKLADFVPAYSETVEGCVGLIFRDPPELGDDVPSEIRDGEGWWENIDNRGTHAEVFLQDAVKVAIAQGFCAILVENMPPLGEGADAAQERESGRRPYWVRYEPMQVLNPYFEAVGGRTVLTQITFQEKTRERDGKFGTKEVIRYRSFFREGDVVRWELVQQASSGDVVEFVLESEGVTGLTEIPVAFILDVHARPVFENLIDLNLSHFRKTSAYNYHINSLQWNQLVVIGDDSKEAKPKPDATMYVPVGGDAKFIAPPSSGADVAFKDLERLEKTMGSFGLRVMLEEGGGNKTAEEVKTEHAKRTSKLSTIVKSIKDAVERALGFMAEYVNLPSGGSVTIGGDVDDLAITPAEFDSLLRAVEGQQLTRLTFLRAVASVIQKRVPDFDPETEAKELQGLEEQANAAIFSEAQATRQSEAANASASGNTSAA